MSIRQDRQGLNTENVSLSLPQFKTYTQNAYNPKPQPTTINTSNIPDTLKALPIWVCWKYELNDKRDKWTKVPYQANCKARAQSTNFKTWCSYADALKSCQSGLCDGIGVFNSYLAKVNPKTGRTLREGHAIAIENFIQGDIDHCFKADGTLTDLAQNILDLLGPAYIEVSPSGTGIRFLCSADIDLKYKKNSELGLELYQHGRYVTITGNVLDNSTSEILDKTSEVQAIYDKYLHKEEKQAPKQSANVAALDLSDFDLLQKMFESSNGAEIKSIYEGYFPEGQRSEYDLKLCNHLAFWTQKNAVRIDALFRQSGLMRPKWDEHRGHDTYGNITIDKAIANCGDVYDPNYGSSPGAKFAQWQPKKSQQYFEEIPVNYHPYSQPFLSSEIFHQHVKANAVTIVQSPLGSAKSTAVSGFLKGKSDVLFATNLTALTEKLANENEATYYKKLDKRDYQDIQNPDGVIAKHNHRSAICINSLPKYRYTIKASELTGKAVDMYPPEYLVIDECDAVTHALYGKHLSQGVKGLKVFNQLKYFIKHAKYVILMSAYIDRTVLELIKQAAPDKPINFVINKCQKEAGRKAYLLESREAVIAKVKELLELGQRVAVPTNSDAFAETLIAGVKADLDKKIFLADKKNKTDKKGKERKPFKDFVNNPDAEYKKYDLIVYTPVFGAGISIEHDGDITIVPYICAQSSSPVDAMQLIHRFRNNKEIHIHIGERHESKPLTYEEVKAETLKTIALDSDLLELKDNKLIIRNENYFDLYIHNEVNKNKEFRDYKARFLELLKATGREVIEAEKMSEAEKQIACDLARQYKEIADNDRAALVVGAEDITATHAKILANESEVTHDEYMSIEKQRITSFYGLDSQEIEDRELFDFVLKDDRGKTRKRVSRLVLARATNDDIHAMREGDMLQSLQGEFSDGGVLDFQLRPLALKRDLYQTVLKLANIDVLTNEQTEAYSRESVLTALGFVEGDNEHNQRLFNQEIRKYSGITSVPTLAKFLKNPLQWLGIQLRSLGFDTSRNGHKEGSSYTVIHKDSFEFELRISTLSVISSYKNQKARCAPALAPSRTAQNQGAISENFEAKQGVIFGASGGTAHA